jgi:hypothetical protein
MRKPPHNAPEMSENRGWRSIHSLLGPTPAAAVAAVGALTAARWLAEILAGYMARAR